MQLLLKHLQHKRVETILNRAMLPRFEQGGVFARDDQPQPTGCRMFGIAPRRRSLATRMRVIMPQHCWAARACLTMRGEQNGGIELEPVAAIGGDIRGSNDRLYPCGTPQQQPANLLRRFGPGMGDDPAEQRS